MYLLKLTHMKTFSYLLVMIFFFSVEKVYPQNPTLYVVNGLAETLSKVDLVSGQVYNHIEGLGVVPNQIVIRDRKAYVVNSISSNIQIISTEYDSTLGYIELGNGRNPWNIAFQDSQTAFVTNFTTGTLSKIDLLNKTVLGEFPIGQSPEGIFCFKGKVYVCNTGFNFTDFTYGQGTVAIFDPAGDSILKVLNVGKNPQALKAHSSFEIQVVCTGDYQNVQGAVYIINTLSDSVTDSILIGGTPASLTYSWEDIAYLPAGGFGESGFVYTYNFKTKQILRDTANPLLVGTGAVDAKVSRENFAYIASLQADSVYEINQAGEILQTFPVGDGPLSLAIYDPRMSGDLNGNDTVSVSDVVFLINFIFKRGLSPSPLAIADVNCDYSVRPSDLVYLINYLFRFGVPPLQDCN